jgi:hypothetical protein
LPNNVPVYGLKTGGTAVGLVKCDSSDRIVLGDGSEDCYINSSGNIVFPDDSSFLSSFSGKDEFMSVDGSSNLVTFGGTSFDVRVGWGTALTFSGLNSSSASDPTTTDFPAATWGIHRNTSSGAVFLVANYGGLKKVELT